MKIIEALKKVKHDRQKITDLQRIVQRNAARMESEKSEYADQKKYVNECLQSIASLRKNIDDLLVRIQKTNLATTVTVEIDGNQVQKSIAQWIVRRREGVDEEIITYTVMSVGNLKPKPITKADGEIVVDQVVVNFDPIKRDKALASLKEEKFLIDSALEIANATTDLLD